jgi:hypothetical protein
MKNIYRFIFAISIMGMLQIGCSEDFLEQTKTDGMSEDVLFKVPEDGVAAVNGVYDLMHNNHIDFVIKGIWYNANFLSQDVNNWGADIFYTTYEIPVTFKSCNDFWTVGYIGIARANQVIEILKSMTDKGILTQDLGNRLTAECLFLRGFYYTQLASNFGEVPLILQPSKDGREPQATQDEVFKAVADDMMKAAETLPWTYDAANVGRATRAAALAYAGEAYMWIKDYAKAEAALQQIRDYAVANPNVIGLEEKFWDIHELSHENGKEAIFSIQYTTPENRDWSNPDDCQWLQNFTMPDEVNGTGYAYASKKLWEAYQPGDTRRIATVIGPGEEHPTCPINSYPKIKNAKPEDYYYGLNTVGTPEKPWDKVGRSGYYVNKFWRLPASVIDGTRSAMWSELNLIMMRYAQVILDLAEAKWRNGKDGEALALVKEVRSRAFGSNAAPEPTGTMAEILVNEYRLELAGEFSEWFILRRMGEHIKFVKNTYGITIPAGRDIIPIPQAQLDVNKNLHQTSGYLTN